ncbi:transposase [Candidatus Halocynthiibacter alkanivorans]|uniref:transposase n=2 Tax=Candidatus Halocynthiibacter alkanivorans TaxID=2267619 RepID=UPI000DF15272|nr:transposase [Candidatus Halocynthiibacter alkanivorans]
MAPRYSEEFQRDAVRIATTSGLTRPRIASDLGVGVSTLNKWVQQHQNDDLMSGPHEDVEKENARLRKENRVLREEREVLKKATIFFAGQKA